MNGYKKILIPVDNSTYSNYSIDIGISLAKKFNSLLVGNHVYAARLHDDRFQQMEKDLPPAPEEEAAQRRKIHDSMITKGLEIISHSYLDNFQNRCLQAGVRFQRKISEGKNFLELIKDIQKNGYDLVIMGYKGLGALETTLLGSCCERVVRKIRTDALIVKEQKPYPEKILVAVDGSEQSFRGLKVGLMLAKSFFSDIEVVSTYDPYFHQVAFTSIARVLSEEARELFRFKEQEQIHEEIINKGLAKIYRRNLEKASEIAGEEGIHVKTILLAGKAYHQILKYIERSHPSLLIVGRFGLHRADGVDMGSTPENLLRLAPCNILLTN